MQESLGTYIPKISKDVLLKLKWTGQEVIANADYKLKQPEIELIISPFWEEFEKNLIGKWLLALHKCREGEYEAASEILEKISERL